MIEVRNEWLGQIFENRPDLDADAVRKDVAWLYEMSGLESPVVIVLDSPMACQIAANVLRQVKAGRSLGQVAAQVRAKVRDQIWDQVRDQVRDQVEDQVRDQVWRQVGAQVEDQVWRQVGAQVLDWVWDQVVDQVVDQVAGRVGYQVGSFHYESPTWANFLGHAGFGAWADYWQRMGIVSDERVARYINYLRRGVYYSIFLRGVAFVCGPPIEIHLDSEHRLHRDDGPAILWRDGWAIHAWHGLRVPATLIERPHEITREDLMREGGDTAAFRHHWELLRQSQAGP